MGLITTSPCHFHSCQSDVHWWIGKPAYFSFCCYSDQGQPVSCLGKSWSLKGLWNAESLWINTVNTKSRKHVREETSLDLLIPAEANWQGQKGRQTGLLMQMTGKSQKLETDQSFTPQGLAQLLLGSLAIHLLCVSNKREQTSEK